MWTSRWWSKAAGAALAVVLAVAPALLCPPSADAAGLLIPTGQENSLAIARQHVRVHINNGIAVTTVDQVFRNHSPQQLEAVYRFPVPENASVSNFSMWINGKEVIGEVLEKQRARQIYTEITTARRDPGLLEQTTYKWFEMRVFPVPANGEQRIQIAYYQPCDYDAGYLVYTYPLETVGVTRAELEGEFSVLVDVASAIPMERVYSPSHEKELLVRETTRERFRAGVEVAKGSLDRDFVLVMQLAREKTGVDLVTSRRDGDDGYFMLTVTPSADVDKLAEPVNYIFVLDVSGSMRELGKLAMARSAVQQMLSDLRADDTFSIISFNIAPEAMANAALPASQENKERAAKWLAGLNAAGGTDLLPALQLAAGFQAEKTRNAIVLVSDGQATGTESHAQYLRLINTRAANTTVFSFGLGNDVNRPLLGALARQTGGFADYVSGQEDLSRKVKSLKSKIDSPVMTGVKIDFGGQAVERVLPAAMPNLYRGQQLVVFGRYRQASKGQVALHATIGGKPATVSADVEWPERDTANPEVERMWAQRACETLNAMISAGQGVEADGRQVEANGQKIEANGQKIEANAQQIEAYRRQIVQLATHFSIVTPYTSFLVLENEAEFKRYNIDRLNAQRVADERRAQDQRNAWTPTGAPGGVQTADRGGDGVPVGSGNGGGSVEWVFFGGFGALLALGWPRKRKSPGLG